jgi:uncharacterized protein (DUF1810 family)
MSHDSNLKRFVDAQASAYQNALSEIKNGRKQSHWMWYVFPQVKGLGFSSTSKYYAIDDLGEAEAFLNHPVLGSRLLLICNELLELKTNDATRIFGSPDDVKLRSSMTLFSYVQNADPVFQLVIDKFFNGMKDNTTLQILSEQK